MRNAEIDLFLADTAWANAMRTALPFDASLRRYHRLTLGEETAILMDAPPKSGEDLPAFLHFAQHLADCGLSTPSCYKADVPAGFLLLEDFGAVDFAIHLTNKPDDEDLLYSAAAQALAQLHQHPVPAAPNYKVDEMCQAAQLAPLWYGDGHKSPALDTVLQDLLSTLAQDMTVLALRDYHAQNLMWMPSRAGIKRVGQLDFQSAGISHPCYDLCSLIYDVRRDVSKAGRTAAVHAFAKATGQNVNDLTRPIAILTLQRNIRILGAFGRLASLYGRPSYLGFLPRVWGFVTDALDAIDDGSLSQIVLDVLPPPDQARSFIDARTAQ